MPRRGADEAITDQGVARWVFELSMHAAQREVFEHPARFKVIAAGRRWGKTLLAIVMCIIVAVSKPDAEVMWVSPSHKQSRSAMRKVAKLIPRKFRSVNRTTQEITLATGGRITFCSGERPDNLRGEGLDLVVLDEAAFVPEAVWTQVLRPALGDRQGKAILISTFDGENWFYHLYRRALAADNTEWAGWRFPTTTNPYYPVEDLEEARANMPSEVFEQEFMANPLAFSGAVFNAERLDEAWAAGGLEFVVPKTAMVRKGGALVPVPVVADAGLDWGWNVTALEVGVELPDGRIAWVDEHIYKRTELTERCEAIARVCKAWGIQIIYADAAGADENVTLAGILERAGVPTCVQPVPFATFKKAGILTRRHYLDKGREVIAHRCTQLLADSKLYHYEPDGEKPAKGDDHTVDAATAFYAPRAWIMAESDDDDEREAA